MYPNQVETANKICQELQSKKYCILIAEMQSGKTGYFLTVALLSIERDVSKEVIIFSGASSKSLGHQVRDDLEHAIRDKSRQESIMNRELTTPEQKKTYFEQRIVFYKEKIKIVWGKKQIKSLSKINPGTLLIHDESHYAQDTGCIPYKFIYKKFKIMKCLYGDNSDLIEKDISVLSVSATPISEVVSYNEGSNDKALVFAEPGVGFCGIQTRRDNGKISYIAKQVTSNNIPYIVDIIEENKDHYEDRKKYFIFRGRSNDMDYYNEIARKSDCCLVKINQDSIESLSIFDREPTRNTIVVFYAMARMGDVINKEHIAMAYEYSRHLPNADATLQGLLGRLNGYYNTFDIPMTYLSENVKCHIDTYCECMSSQTAMHFNKHRKANNIMTGRRRSLMYQDRDGQIWVKTVPFQLDEKPTLTQLNELLESRGRPSVNSIRCRNSEESTYRYNKTMELFKNEIRTNKRFCYNFTNMITKYHTDDIVEHQIIGSEREGYIVYGYEKYNYDTHSELLENNNRELADKCIFKYQTSLGEVIENMNGGITKHFPEESSSNRVLFKECVKECIRDSLTQNILTSCRCISSVYCHDTEEVIGIRINKVASQSIETFLEILKLEMFVEYNVELQVTIREENTDHVVLESIKW